NNQLSDVPALPPSLEVLKMNTNELGALGPHCFTGLVNLLNLELLGNTLHEAAVSPSAFRALENLLSLQVDQNHFTSVPLGLPRSLQMLKMSGNMIDSVTEEALRGCSNLRLLDLSGNQLHEQSIPANAWTHLKSLEALDLSSNQLESVPANLPRRLRKLTLRNNNIGHVPAVSFRHLRPGLQSLQLSHNRLGDGSADRASFVGTYRSMGELLLDNNHLGEVPPFIRQFKSLTMLRLDNNRIRTLKQWDICHPRNSASALAALHLENNHLQVEKIPTDAFSCLIDPQGLVL
uniref:Uncharacterized protein n=1 Tax=Tetraodon nigroviridis TaxID=99883 RepID=H3CEK2_TETNG